MLKGKDTCVVGVEAFLVKLIDCHHSWVGFRARLVYGFLFEDVSSRFIGGNVGGVEIIAKLVFCQFNVGDGITCTRNEVHVVAISRI